MDVVAYTASPRRTPGSRKDPFEWQNGLFVLGALGAPAWVSMLQAP